jgi:Putative adhesin
MGMPVAKTTNAIYRDLKEVAIYREWAKLDRRLTVANRGKDMAEEKWLIDGPKVIDLGPVRRLKVALVRGQVDIVGHDEASTRIEVHSVAGKELRVTLNGDTLEIDHPQLRWDNFIEVFRSFRGSARADVSVLVPRDVALTLGVVSSTALISGLHRDANVSTVSGDVVLDGIVGDLTLNSVSGELSIQDHAGNINARTVSGDITAAGDISRFTSDGVSGEVFLDIQGSPDTIRVNTVSGNVTARLEDGFGADYRINTVSGRIQLDDSEITGVRGGYAGKYGTLDRSWLEFRANTVGGNIAVLHAKAAKPARASGRKGPRA